MPETTNGRELVKMFLETNEATNEDMAKMFGVSPQYLGAVLNGKKVGPKPNKLILAIIQAFGI